MKVLIVQLPHFYEGTGRAPTIYPLGIGYLASTLKNNHDVVPLDLWIDNVDVDDAVKRVGETDPDVIGISVYSTQYPYYKRLVASLKEKFPDIPIIAGGPGATFSYNIFLNHTETDICVIGEGDITFPELLDNLDMLDAVDGIAYKADGQIVVTSQRRQVADIDSLPLPDREFFDFDRYVLNSMKHQAYFKNLRCNSLITSRGCPYHCTFCSKTFSGSRMRSIESIETELFILKDEYRLEAVEFDDELVLINKKRAIDICEMMKRVDLPWGCQGRINVVNDEVMGQLSDAGCRYVGYGVESYTQSILDNMKKRIKVSQIIPVIELTRKYGIEPLIQYMYGFPGEDDQSIENTYQFFKEIDYPFIGMITTPLPGTPLYEMAVEQGKIDDEEAYLLDLTSGYNYSKPLANMTDFTDQEFIQKRQDLENKINAAYYRRHPVEFAKSLFGKFAYICKMLIKDPKLFVSKICQQLKILCS